MLQRGRRSSSAEVTVKPKTVGCNVELQRGRRSSSAEVARAGLREHDGPVASTGPPIFIGGSLGKSGIKRGGPSSFNGAADLHRRKSREDRQAPRGARASTGPPIFIGGSSCFPN